jgi:hypothetical protein
MRTYYRGPDCVVTSEVFLWRAAPAKFAIRDLRDVGIAHHEIARPVPIAAYVAGVALLTAAALTSVWNTVVLYAFVTMAAIALTTFVALRLRVRPALLELRGSYCGKRAILYATVDERVFNQVTRALRRAIEEANAAGDIAAA